MRGRRLPPLVTIPRVGQRQLPHCRYLGAQRCRGPRSEQSVRGRSRCRFRGRSSKCRDDCDCPVVLSTEGTLEVANRGISSGTAAGRAKSVPRETKEEKNGDRPVRSNSIGETKVECSMVSPRAPRTGAMSGASNRSGGRSESDGVAPDERARSVDTGGWRDSEADASPLSVVQSTPCGARRSARLSVG